MDRKVRWGAIAVGVGLAAAIALAASEYTGRGGDEVKFIEKGTASWYGPGFHGRKTASGERFNQNDLTAAHKKLPLGSEATVTNLENGKSVEVEINDRGPYVQGRKIDLSKAAAKKIGVEGTAKVKIEATADQLDPGKDEGESKKAQR